MTTQGAEPSGPADPVDEDLGWDHPLTRLILLLEIADQPDWLRDLVPPAAHATAALRQNAG